MPKKNDDDEVRVTPQAVRMLAESLRAIAARHDDIAAWMETDGIESVQSKNLKSAIQGMVQIGKFAGAVTSAAVDHLTADGLKELEGGIALLERYLNRTAKSLNPKTAAAVAEGRSLGAATVQKSVQEKPKRA